jgi:hypothetical protein
MTGPALNPHLHELAVAFRDSKASQVSWSGDISWALALYDRAGNEVIKIGFDDSGRNGFVDSNAVRLNGGLLKWAKSVLPR